MKKIILVLLLIGCSKSEQFTKSDIINSKVETCNDLINIFLPPQLEKQCRYDELTDKVLIQIKNPATGRTHMYDSKTGEEIL